MTRPTYCKNCNALLTDADSEARRCTQCGQRINPLGHVKVFSGKTWYYENRSHVERAHRRYRLIPSRSTGMIDSYRRLA